MLSDFTLPRKWLSSSVLLVNENQAISIRFLEELNISKGQFSNPSY